MSFSPIASNKMDTSDGLCSVTPRKRLIMADVSSSFELSDTNMSIDKETPTRPERINVITAKGKLFGKAPLPLSPLINKSTGTGKLQNHGFLVVRKRRSLTTSSPRLKKRISNEEKENFDLASDNLCSVVSDDEDDDEEDDVFAAIQDVIKKPIIKIDRSILKRKSPETADGTPRRTRRCLSLSSPPKSKIVKTRDQERLIRKRSKSVTEHTIPSIIDVPLDRRNLIGDFSAPHSLQIIPGRHSDLSYITSHTLANILKDSKTRNVIIIDARYPYEYEGGHISTANNFYIQKEIDDFFFTKESIEKRQRSILVFHCEFSSERAPRQLRYLRACDRTRNPYPRLHYPEIYLLKGGYKEFYHTYKELCVPEEYLPMLDDRYTKEYKLFRTGYFSCYSLFII